MNMTEEQLEQLGLVEITFGKSDDFLKIKETLTRIGIPNLERIRYLKRVTSYISAVSIISRTSYNCLC